MRDNFNKDKRKPVPQRYDLLTKGGNTMNRVCVKRGYLNNNTNKTTVKNEKNSCKF